MSGGASRPSDVAVLTPRPRVGPREIVYQDPFQQIYRVVADFGSFTKEYFVRDTGERAAVVVVGEGTVLLVRQYRLLINCLSWEIPGGRVESGETPKRAAVRECLEEAGVRCWSLRPLLTYHPWLDILHNPTHVFVTEDWEVTLEARVEPVEVQERTWVPLPRCLEMIAAGEIVDSLSIVGLLAYQAFGAAPGNGGAR